MVRPGGRGGEARWARWWKKPRWPLGGRWCMPRARGGHGGSRGREAAVVDAGEGEHTL